MTEYEYEQLMDLKKVNEIYIHDLPENYEGTLVYGYTCNRESFHFYAKDGVFHRLFYVGNSVVHYDYGGIYEAAQCVPDKRVYRQESQYFFLHLLKKRDIVFSVTDSISPKDYSIKVGEFAERAKILEDLNNKESTCKYCSGMGYVEVDVGQLYECKRCMK